MGACWTVSNIILADNLFANNNKSSSHHTPSLMPWPGVILRDIITPFQTIKTSERPEHFYTSAGMLGDSWHMISSSLWSTHSKFDPCPQKLTHTYEFDLKPLLIFEPAMDTSLETTFTAASRYKKQSGQMQMLMGMMFGWDKSTDFTWKLDSDSCRDLAKVTDQTVNRSET